MVKSTGTYAQDTLSPRLQKELDAQQYTKIIAEDAPKSYDYPAEAVYLIGMAYYLQNDDFDCIKYMNLAIGKDPGLAKAFYIKGMAMGFENENEKAIQVMQTAISIDPANSEYHTALGDIYFKAEAYPQALAAYQDAIKQAHPVERAYTMIPQVYFAQNKKDKALQAFYNAKEKLPKQSESYRIALYNIGLLENLKPDYDKAEAVLTELLNLAPENYRAMAELMQSLYGKKEYEKASPWRTKLYEAYAAGKLKNNLKTSFCYAQFTWKDKRIEAFEKFDAPKEKGDVKYVFYIMGADEKMEYKLQTEYIPTIGNDAHAMKYNLCKDAGDIHLTYNIQYGESPDFETMKKDVISVLDGKVKVVE